MIMADEREVLITNHRPRLQPVLDAYKRNCMGDVGASNLAATELLLADLLMIAAEDGFDVEIALGTAEIIHAHRMERLPDNSPLATQ